MPLLQKSQIAQDDPLCFVYSGSHFGLPQWVKKIQDIKQDNHWSFVPWFCIHNWSKLLGGNWIFGLFSWLGNGYDGGFSPGRGKLSSFPNIIKNLWKALERSFRKMLQNLIMYLIRTRSCVMGFAKRSPELIYWKGLIIWFGMVRLQYKGVPFLSIFDALKLRWIMCRGWIEGYCLADDVGNIPWLCYFFAILLNMFYGWTAPLTLDFTDHVPAFLHRCSGI